MSLSKIEKNPPSCVKKFGFEATQKYRSLYKDITSNGVNLQYHHRHALGELAVMLVEAELLREALYGDEGGETMKVQGDRNIVTKRNPARDALEKLRTPILRLMKEFRMTPSSVKTTLHTPGSSASSVDDEFDEIGN